MLDLTVEKTMKTSRNTRYNLRTPCAVYVMESKLHKDLTVRSRSKDRKILRGLKLESNSRSYNTRLLIEKDFKTYKHLLKSVICLKVQ